MSQAILTRRSSFDPGAEARPPTPALTPTLTERPAWKALNAHFQTIRGLHDSSTNALIRRYRLLKNRRS